MWLADEVSSFSVPPSLPRGWTLRHQQVTGDDEEPGDMMPSRAPNWIWLTVYKPPACSTSTGFQLEILSLSLSLSLSLILNNQTLPITLTSLTFKLELLPVVLCNYHIMNYAIYYCNIVVTFSTDKDVKYETYLRIYIRPLNFMLILKFIVVYCIYINTPRRVQYNSHRYDVLWNVGNWTCWISCLFFLVPVDFFSFNLKIYYRKLKLTILNFISFVLL